MKKSSYSKVLSFALLFVLTFVFCNSSCLAQKVNTTTLPSWVKKVPIPYTRVDSSSITDNSHVQYIGFHGSRAEQVYTEIQINVDKEEQFVKVISKLYRDKDIEEVRLEYPSKDVNRKMISISTFQGNEEKELIKKTNWTAIDIKEYVADRLWESRSVISFAIDNLSKDDIYSYSYLDESLRSDVELGDGIFHQTEDSTYVYLRVISQKRLEYQSFNGFPSLIVKEHDDHFEYIAEGLAVTPYKGRTPYHFIRRPFVVLSSFKNLQDAGANFKNQFLVKEDASRIMLDELAAQLTANQKDDASKIQKIINYAQDSIMYQNYGLVRAYEPAWCLQGKRADCKAKTLIVIELLKRIGIDAQPVLVNSPRYVEQLDSIPSGFNFNHVIVQFEYNGQKILVDPTSTKQTDKIGAYPVTGFGKSLVIHEDAQETIDILSTNRGKIEIRDEITDRVKRTIILNGKMAEDYKNSKMTMTPEPTIFNGPFSKLEVKPYAIHDFDFSFAYYRNQYKYTEYKKDHYNSLSEDATVLSQEVYSVDSLQKPFLPWKVSKSYNPNSNSRSFSRIHYTREQDTIYNGVWELPYINQSITANYHKEKIPLAKIQLDTFDTNFELTESFGHYKCIITENESTITVKQDIYVSGGLPLKEQGVYTEFEEAIRLHQYKVYRLILAKDTRTKEEKKAAKKRKKKWK